MSDPEAVPYRTAADAKRESVAQVQIMLWDSLPLVVGLVIVAAVYEFRVSLFPPSQQQDWTNKVAERALRLSDVGLFVSLVGVKVIDILGELGEALAVAQHRIRQTWRTGIRPPRSPRV